MDEDQPLHTVVETRGYLGRIARLPTEAERITLVDRLAEAPQAGDLMEGTGGARKLRVAALGKGGSGGARVITFYAGPSLPVFVLTAFGKGEKANLSKAERNALRDTLVELVRHYREG